MWMVSPGSARRKASQGSWNGFSREPSPCGPLSAATNQSKVPGIVMDGNRDLIEGPELQIFFEVFEAGLQLFDSVGDVTLDLTQHCRGRRFGSAVAERHSHIGVCFERGVNVP